MPANQTSVVQPQKIYLADYTPPTYLVEHVDLTFRLAPKNTRVLARIRFVPNPAATSRDFFLHGELLTLINASIDGTPVTPTLVEGGLSCDVPDAPFTWESEVEIAPIENTALDGLYMSDGMYCTQCEAEGFRRITYYPDRPDVMAPFTVRIESDLPVLLSNGNPADRGADFAVWHDPWPKPSYLFALVAGNLVAKRGSFDTMSGKHVDLAVWTRPADAAKADFAVGALQRAMKWDEDVYGREYDLDVFNIVAVSDFNSGAMENKGLNIFNTAAVLASPDTATDLDYERVEGVIAHEYFHNWTGNRITCRDWFQLSLKEGLTVFRDQQFTGDLHGHATKRIRDVIKLRARQFREDNGPLAHNVRPESFVEISNFYTGTIYEKGAEVIRMLRTLVGPEAYAKALDLYFARHDGQAATIEDWLQVFVDATGRDLTQFKRWYSQAGTPRVAVTEDYTDGTLTLTLRQTTPPTPGQTDKQPLVIPVAVGLLNPNGDEVVPTTVLELTGAEQTFTFSGLASRPVASVLRGFSAPVILQREQSAEELAFLMAHDTDSFVRWDSGRALACQVLVSMVRDHAAPLPAYLDAIAATLADETLDPALRAFVLDLPSEESTAQTLFDLGATPEPDAIHDAHEALKNHLAEHMVTLLPQVYAACQINEAYTPDAAQAGKRALANAVLNLISRNDGGATAEMQFTASNNMTLSLGALHSLLDVGQGRAELAAFAQRWADDRLVIDKWFSLQVSLAAPRRLLAVLTDLTGLESFDWKNPNRFRAVFGAITSNPAGFHQADGSVYRLMADWLIRLDSANPWTASRLSAAFDGWRRYDKARQGLMRAQIERIAKTPAISREMAEMVGRMLG
ncbi:aminopeptidase N [Ketogulonicigenium robustum]|uniref:Aminopeptidase N n=1 Tax=Ketogulonicigenium robustum TaxID=92947 RepID=A0A1W6NZV7_9RHOB|nr:aminopeptidase N [Ketogulonicigenium robustum]ARO14796.1 aminopeptidase N [Ketogulonicigenium robustum]